MVRRPTDPAHEREVLRLVEHALEVPPPKRLSFLDESCGRRTALRARVERLLELEREGELPAPVVPPLGPFAGSQRARHGVCAGDRLGAYELVERIGQGGMGEVWRARRADGSFEREVAVKLLHPGLLRPALVRRFEQERRILAGLRHEGIATLLDGGLAEGAPYLVMELVRGTPLDEHCQARALPLESRLGLFLAVVRAVAHAHAAGVVHRDIKPSNVLVQEDGRVVLLDFGIAKLLELEAGSGEELTASGERVLTPRYASPEQHAGLPLGPRSDVYSLGLLLHELLTGRHPFEDELAAGRAPRSPRETPVPPAPSRVLARTREPGARRTARRLRGDLDTIVGATLRPDPERRYASAAELAEDLERHLAGRPILARPATLGYRAAKLARRQPVAATAGAIALLSLGAALLFGLGTARETRAAERLAEAETELQGRILEHLERTLRLSDPQLVRTRLRETGEEATLAALRDDLGEVEARYGDAPRIEGRLRLRVAEALHTLGRLDDAEAELARARAALDAALEPDHPDILRARVLGALIDRARGGRATALAELRAVAELAAARHPEDDALALDVRASLAITLGICERPAEARGELVALRALAARVKGEGSDWTLATEAWLADVLYDLGELEEAEQVARGALQGLLAAVGEDHPLVAEVRGRLGELLMSTLRTSEAARELDLALELFARWATDDDPQRLRARASRAWVRRLSGEAVLAERELREIIPIMERSLGPETPAVLVTREYLAATLHDQGRADDALATLAPVLEAWRRREGHESDRHYLSACANRAAFLFGAERFAEAEEAYRELVPRVERIAGRAHPQTLTPLSNLAAAVIAQGRPAEAETILRDVIARDAERAEDPLALGHRVGLASALLRKGQQAEAEAELRAALAAFERLDSYEQDISYLRALDLLAWLRQSAGALEEAEGLWGRALDLKLGCFGAGHKESLYTLHALCGVRAGLRAKDEPTSEQQEAVRLLTDLLSVESDPRQRAAIEAELASLGDG